MSKIHVLGCDPALANMAFARMSLDLEHLELDLLELSIVQTERGADKKVVRASSVDLRRAQELHAGMQSASKGCRLCFAEIPSGAQSASAARGLGIAVGVVASCPIPLIQVQPLEVKMASVRSKTATKKEMIDWAFSLYPNANWMRARGKSDGPLVADNEHMADAVGAVHAGILTKEFEAVRKIVMF